MTVHRDRLQGIYSIKKHEVKQSYPKQNNKENLTSVGASVFSSRFSVSLKEDKS